MNNHSSMGSKIFVTRILAIAWPTNIPLNRSNSLSGFFFFLLKNISVERYKSNNSQKRSLFCCCELTLYM